jgi:hypothetical protein
MLLLLICFKFLLLTIIFCSYFQARLSSTPTNERKKSKPLRPKNVRKTSSPGNWSSHERVLAQVSPLANPRGLWPRQHNPNQLQHHLPEAAKMSRLYGVIFTVDHERRTSGSRTTLRHRRRKGPSACCATKPFQRQVLRI